MRKVLGMILVFVFVLSACRNEEDIDRDTQFNTYLNSYLDHVVEDVLITFGIESEIKSIDWFGGIGYIKGDGEDSFFLDLLYFVTFEDEGIERYIVASYFVVGSFDHYGHVELNADEKLEAIADVYTEWDKWSEDPLFNVTTYEGAFTPEEISDAKTRFANK